MSLNAAITAGITRNYLGGLVGALEELLLPEDDELLLLLDEGV
jgi:hypothetical protein